MSGKKGRSGRRTWLKELEYKEVLDLSWRTIKHALKSDQLSLAEKAKIANVLCSKDLHSKTTSKVELTNYPQEFIASQDRYIQPLVSQEVTEEIES